MWNRRERDMLEMWTDLLNQIEQVPYYSPKDGVEVNEENGVLNISVELAGLSKDQVDVEISNRTVTITAESDKKNFDWTRTFNYELDTDSVKATMVNGILDLAVEKKEKTSARKVEIE
tara:strand:+ start:996 stop:1349 length:354 start_codon:yes stop_codon:yes gene_type:complete